MNDIQYYDANTGQLTYSQKHKIKKLLEHNCIQYNKTLGHFVCKPIPKYNITTYNLKKEGDKFTCNCQGYNKKVKLYGEGYCSHIAALYEYLKIKEESKLEPIDCPYCGSLLTEEETICFNCGYERGD